MSSVCKACSKYEVHGDKPYTEWGVCWKSGKAGSVCEAYEPSCRHFEPREETPPEEAVKDES